MTRDSAGAVLDTMSIQRVILQAEFGLANDRIGTLAGYVGDKNELLRFINGVLGGYIYFMFTERKY